MDELRITDNVHDGYFDTEMLANDFDLDKLLAWGLPKSMVEPPAPRAKKAEQEENQAKTCPHCGGDL
jgi:hypothetical protein